MNSFCYLVPKSKPKALGCLELYTTLRGAQWRYCGWTDEAWRIEITPIIDDADTALRVLTGMDDR